MNKIWAGLFLAATGALGLWTLVFVGGSRAELGRRTDELNVSASKIREHVFYLASDELRGRSAGSADYSAAADYVERELRAAGVQPLFAEHAEHSDGVGVAAGGAGHS